MLSAGVGGGGGRAGVPNAAKRKKQEAYESFDNAENYNDVTMDLNCNHFQFKKEENR